jgi:hypothetical protein
MTIRKNLLLSILFGLGTFHLLINTKLANATVIKYPIFTLGGTVDPITYTDSDGTFTTSPLQLSLGSPSSNSFIEIDSVTGRIFNYLEMNVSFNNGKPGILNQDISGVFTTSGEGFFGSQPIDLTILSSNLSGAGEFSGAKTRGKNPLFFEVDENGDFCILKWRFSPPGSPAVMFLDLPQGFQNGTNIPIHGDIDATCPSDACLVPVPEPSSILGFLALGTLGAASTLKRKLKPSKSTEKETTKAS